MKVQKILKGIDNLWFVKVQQVAVRGTPDILICYKGKFFAWELKVDSKLSPLQEYTLECIDIAGGVARVVTPTNLDNMVEELYGRS